MAEYNNDNYLDIGLPYNNELPIYKLAALFNNRNQSYKFFWFMAILEEIKLNHKVIKYETLINRMISEAWYMVSEYHLNLGPSDAIEKLVIDVGDESGLKHSATEKEIIEFLEKTDSARIRKARRDLACNVPYRLQSPFLKDRIKSTEWGDYDVICDVANSASDKLYAYIHDDTDYYIRVNESWMEYLKDNMAIVIGWTKGELIDYLQHRNPNIPGLPFKIDPPQTRNLKDAMNYWRALIIHGGVVDIYTGNRIDEENEKTYGGLAIDHYIPWSYVTNDEMWNLTPTFQKINSSKSNSLPDNKLYLKKMIQQQYDALQITRSNSEIGSLFKKYIRNNLNSNDMRMKLYDSNPSYDRYKTTIKDAIIPLYNSARSMGFTDWSYRGNI